MPSQIAPTVLLLAISNIFMTTAWYWHLKGGPEAAAARPVFWVIAMSWGHKAAFACIMAGVGFLFIGKSTSRSSQR
ncbi:DMT family protein [Blastomonas sp. AAP53]|uniref:DMT family protein n=1 Tax=Blastomonas sp. AAP53 TaxID=1248760 RepID=UPI0002F7B491|nr:DMT family protein [Blastomonas sp. AAP53]